MSNGMRALFVPSGGTEAVTLLVLFEVGSRYEARRTHGASHYIEHLMFKGTSRRPNTTAISRELDSVGADYNAFTGKDYTGYYIKLRADRLTLAVDMLEDMLFHSLFRKADLESEREVIIEEIRMYQDNPLMLIGDLFEEGLYRGSTLGWRIGGSVESMRAMSRQDLSAYRSRYYIPQRTVVALAGRFDGTEAIRRLESSFGKRRKARRTGGFRPFRPAGSRGSRLNLERRETEQVQLALGFPAFSLTDRRRPALMLLNTILGGNMSSRLFIKVREREGLCYHIRSSVSAYQDTGSLVVQAGLAKDRLDDALRIIMRELARIRDKGVAAGELRRAKEYARGKMALHLEDSSHLADWYARQELLQGRLETPEERLRRLDAVSAEAVRRVAGAIIRKDRLTLAAIGPCDDDKPLLDHAKLLT